MRARLLILLLALAAPLPAEEPPGKFAKFVERLGSEDAKTRETSARVLLDQGSVVLGELRAALATTKSDIQRAAIEKLIAEIEKREPFGVRFAAAMLKIRIDTNYVNGPDFKYLVSIRNGSDKPVVLWPYFSLRVLDAEGREVAPALRQGRWGRGRSNRYLEQVEWARIAPGETWKFEEAIARYMHGPELITGWKITEPGDYTLEFTYHYDRAAAKKACDPAWEQLDDPQQPWNQALELKHVFTAKMHVVKPRPKGHNPHAGGNPHGGK